MTAESLKNYSCKDLARMAKNRGVPGWHSMRKEQLVKALLKAVRASSRDNKVSSNGSPRSAASRRSASPAARSPVHTPAPQLLKPNKDTLVLQRLQEAKAKVERLKNLSGEQQPAKPHKPAKDRLVVMVRDPFWLHVYWELTRHGVERIRAAMGQLWHSAKPILRLLEVTGVKTTSAAESVIRDIEIHGGVNNWYIDVQDPPKSYRLEIGYLADNGKFFVLSRSNIVTTPQAGTKDAIDENWAQVAENYEKIYAMSGGYDQDGAPGELQELFEERLRRPMGSSLVANLSSGVAGLIGKKKKFSFDIDAELIVYGATDPDAHVTLQGDPVRLRPDGTFTVRFSLPNCRQVIPAVACSGNGLEQQTIVLAVERNTKTMEPLVRDAANEA